MVGLESNGSTDSKSGIDLAGNMNTPKFYLPIDDLTLELTHHDEVMGSVSKTVRLYKIEELEEHYIMVSGIPMVQDPFD